ncbi:fimbrial protein [Providencia vermicola]|uniref:fimbrial protein n=1 Tax=Providencia vermicola TaxID=333965 RepID=UPI003D2CCAD8
MRGKVFSISVFSCIFSSLVGSVAFAASDAGHGRVNMQGAIIDTACAIAVESREQVIDMGVIPFSTVLRDGHGRSQPFSIALINCVLERQGKPDWRAFQVTFDGERDGDYFGVYGEARGVALRIMDEYGNQARPGKALPLRDLVLGDHVLNYTLTLMPNQRGLKAGAYFSTIRFKLDYF